MFFRPWRASVCVQLIIDGIKTENSGLCDLTTPGLLLLESKAARITGQVPQNSAQPCTAILSPEEQGEGALIWGRVGYSWKNSVYTSSW